MVVERRVTGPPGTGKTYFIGQEVARSAERYGSEHVMVTSLTRAAAHEAAGRGMIIPSQNIGTLHHFGYEAIGRPKMAEEQDGITAWNEAVAEHAWSWTLYVTPPNDRDSDESRFDDPFGDEAAPDRPGDRLLAELALARTRCLPREGWHNELAIFSQHWEEWKQETGRRDYCDLIDMAAGVACPIDVRSLFVDEAQDLSKLEMRLVRAWAAEADTLTIVGDSDQAIYTWRGADPYVMWDPAIDPKFVRVLGRSRRVPRAIHAAAHAWIRQLGDRREDVTYVPAEPEGYVSTYPSSWRHPEAIIDMATANALSGRTVMVLASCAYMLGPAIAYMRRKGIPYANPYRLKRGDWNPLFGAGDKVRAGDRILSLLRPRLNDEAPDWTAEDYRRWSEWLDAEKTMVRGGKAALKRASDDDEALYTPTLQQFFYPETMAAALRGDLRWWHEHTLEKQARKLVYPLRVLDGFGAAALTEAPRLWVSTIHGVKGGEADVVILFPDLSKEAGETYTTSEDGRDAWTRVFYVGMTRARDELYLCAPSGGPAVSWAPALATL